MKLLLEGRQPSYLKSIHCQSFDIRIRHRGPDWSGVKVVGPNILCHERLAIVGVGKIDASYVF